MFACMCVKVHGSVGTSFIMSPYCPVLDEEPKPKPHPVRTKVRTWNPDEVVDLAMGVSGIESVEAITVGQLLKNTVGRHGDHPALKYEQNGRWEAISYSEYHSYCIKAAKSFLKVRVGNACVFNTVSILVRKILHFGGFLIYVFRKYPNTNM